MPERAESAYGLLPFYFWRASLPFAAPSFVLADSVAHPLRSGCGLLTGFVSESTHPLTGQNRSHTSHYLAR